MTDDEAPRDLERWAREIAAEQHLERLREVRRTTHFYGRLRNLVYDCEHRGRPAILKLYDDDVVNVEAESLRRFHATNRSDVLSAPALYAHGIVSPTAGWLAIERLPESGRFLESPLGARDRERFVALYVEYRRNFPRTPDRPLTLAESLDAFQFHEFRLMQALERASTHELAREFEGRRRVIDRDSFLPLVRRTVDRLRAVFEGRPLVWGHGHFKPIDVYEHEGGERWALTDFGHVKMLPEGYEPAFAIWWDQLLMGDVSSYDRWRGEIEAWSRLFLDRVDGLEREVLDASVAERAVAAVLESIAVVDDMDSAERRARLAAHERLLEELLGG